MRGLNDMDKDLDGMLVGVETRVESYLSTNKLSEDEWLILEALIARAIDLDIVFANLKKKVKKESMAMKGDGKTSEEISKDVTYILGDLSSKIDNYFDKMDFSDDEVLIFKSLISEKIEQLFVDSMIDERRKNLACSIEEAKKRLGIR